MTDKASTRIRSEPAGPAVLVVLSALTLLAGCQQPQRVLDPLPSPAVTTPYIAQGSPLPPPAPPPPPQTIAGKRVVIDPGHGGKDPGAWKGTRSKLPEKTIVLDIGNRVATTLRQRGAQVTITRSSDRFIELEDRASIAERARADLFVSIHADSARNRAASGTEIHIYEKASSQSRQAALAMVAALKRAGIECRGIQRSNFHVLREHSRPAMLVESGFLTNVGDAQRLNSASYRARLAEAITDGIADYLCR